MNPNSSQPKFVKLNNCLPPANYKSKSCKLCVYVCVLLKEKKPIYIINLIYFNKVIRTELPKQKTQMNPMSKYQEYKRAWTKQKVPGEKDHSNLRWWVREKMKEKPKLVIKKPLSQINRQEWID